MRGRSHSRRERSNAHAIDRESMDALGRLGHARDAFMLGRLGRFVRALPRGIWFTGVLGALVVLTRHWLRAPGPPAREDVALAFEHLDLVHTPPRELLFAGTLAAILVALIARMPRRGAAAITRACIALGAVAACFFFFVRDTHHDLGDGRALLHDPVGAVANGGYYTFLDEVAGMWLPIRIAQVLHAHGMQAVVALERAYVGVSIASGVLFVVAVALAGRHVPQRALFATVLVVNAHNRLFAGYIENYPACFALLACVFLLGTGELRAKSDSVARVIGIAILSGVAVTFHAVAVWSVFALAYFALVPRGPFQPRAATASMALVAGLGTLLAAYLLFSLYLTPGVGFVHATRLTASMPTVLHERAWAEHRMAIARVALPGLVLIASSAIAAPRAVLWLLRARDVRFALLWLLGFGAHQALWPSTIGLTQDWDLFSLTWLPLAYLGFRATTTAVCRRGIDPDRGVLAATFALAVIGGLSWVVTGTI
jgi:hypothetical protein